jgi:hypothetical protein
MTQPHTPQPAPADALPRWTIERMSLFIEICGVPAMSPRLRARQA